MAHLCTAERQMGATGIGDGEGTLGEEVQDSTGIVEEFEGLTTGVDDGGSDLELLQFIDTDVRGRRLDGQTVGDGGNSGDCSRIGEEGSEGSMEGRRKYHDSGGSARRF